MVVQGTEEVKKHHLNTYEATFVGFVFYRHDVAPLLKRVDVPFSVSAETRPIELK